LEGGACVALSSPSGENRLGASVCAPLAQNKINLSLLTHVTGGRGADSLTVLCTAGAAGPGSYTLLKTQSADRGVFRLLSGTCLISLFPHDRRPEITGNFLRSLGRARVVIHGLASSPASISAILLEEARERTVRVLFQHFRFPAYRTPQEFYATQRPPEELLRAVVAAYQEKVIRIYCLEHKSHLDLWELSVPSAGALDALGAALVALGESELRIPFLVAAPWLVKQELLFSFGAASERAAEVRSILAGHLPALAPRRQTPVAAIFVHGPHFGDRYGIAHTLVQSLERAHLLLLALSCAVSSITVLVRQQDLAAALQVLGETFEVPQAQCRPAAREG
jgi:aspartokinase